MTLTRQHTRNMAALSLFAILTACGGQQQAAGPPPEFKFEIEAKVTDEATEKGVAGLPVLLDGKPIGYTDRDGKFLGLITEKPKTEVTLTIGEHDAYRRLPNQVYEKTQALNLKYNKERTGLLADSIQIYTVVASAEVDYLVWVAADCGKDLEPQKCAGLPVKVKNEVVATTDVQGRAHFVHVDTPGKTIDVTIETGGNDASGELRNIVPANPTFSIELGKSSEVYAINETFEEFEEDAPKKKTRRVAKKRSSKKSRRSGSKSKKSSSKKSSKKTSKKSTKKATKKTTKKETKGSKEDPISLF